MPAVEHRLAAVERQLRFHRVVIAGLLVALVVLVGYGATEGVREESHDAEDKNQNRATQSAIQER